MFQAFGRSGIAAGIGLHDGICALRQLTDWKATAELGRLIGSNREQRTKRDDNCENRREPETQEDPRKYPQGNSAFFT
jgi:hypothetical protein